MFRVVDGHDGNIKSVRLPNYIYLKKRQNTVTNENNRKLKLNVKAE